MQPIELPEVMAEPLTPESFLPYGRLLGKPTLPPDIETGDWLGYWHALDEVGFERRPVWGYLEVRYRPMILDKLERHCRAQEVFIPSGGMSLMPFATGGDPETPGSKPDPATLKVFLIDGSLSLIVGRGVWHAPAFPINRVAGFLLALEYETPTSDLDLQDVGPYRLNYASLGAWDLE